MRFLVPALILLPLTAAYAQVTRLFSVDSSDAVLGALAATQVAAVGPIVTAALVQRGVNVSAQPHATWFMKPLAAELAKLLGSPDGHA